MSSKRWAALIIAIGLFLVSVFYQIGTSIPADQNTNLMNNENRLFKEKVIKRGGLGGGKIAVLNLEGVIMDSGEIPFMSNFIYDHKRFLQMIETAGKDESVDGIIMKINSPGGGVVESAEIHDKLVEFKEEYQKPIYVSMGNTAASGGYYVSAPSDKIIAHPATITGSIGVIMENINFSELADEYGIDFNTIKSGEFKDIMSSSRPMTGEEETILQTIIDDMYEDFVDVIVQGRGMSVDTVKDIADGRIYTGKQAKELNLVDELGTFDDTIQLMSDDYGLKNPHVIQYEAGIGISQLFGLTVKNIFQSKSELRSIVNLIRDSGGPRAMYLYSR